MNDSVERILAILRQTLLLPGVPPEEILEDLIETLNRSAIARSRAGKPREALAIYRQALDLADALDVETRTVAFNASLLLLEIEKEERISWAPRAYDRWMRRLKWPLELEAGRDDWIMESFERIGRPEYAATVRALLKGDPDPPVIEEFPTRGLLG